MNDEPKRKFKGVFINKKVWLHSDFSWLEKCVIAEIDSLSDEAEPCIASNDYLAKMFQVSCRRMINILSDLRKKKAIKTVSFDGKRRGMIVNPKLSALPESGNPALPDSGNPALPESGNPHNGSIYKGEVLEERIEEKDPAHGADAPFQLSASTEQKESDYARFMKEWGRLFQEAIGTKYIPTLGPKGKPEYGRDGKALKDMLASGTCTVEELMALAKRMWAHRTNKNCWRCANTVAIWSFLGNISAIEGELSVAENGCSQGRDGHDDISNADRENYHLRRLAGEFTPRRMA